MIQAAVRAGALDPATASIGNAPRDLLDGMDDRIAAELAYIQRLLEAIGSELINDPIMVQRHAIVLQNFDLASQVLGHLANILTADDLSAAIEGIGMEELRTRLLRKAVFSQRGLR